MQLEFGVRPQTNSPSEIRSVLLTVVPADNSFEISKIAGVTKTCCLTALELQRFYHHNLRLNIDYCG